MNIYFVIPVYRPNLQLIELVQNLQHLGVLTYVVDDGNTEDFSFFEQIKKYDFVRVIHHAVNQGKGAALKSAFNAILLEDPSCFGCITMDADGQHHIEDILAVYKVAKENHMTFQLGVRSFGINVPLRSKIGNSLTKVVWRLLTGQKITDTQTGLRYIPTDLMKRCLNVVVREILL